MILNYPGGPSVITMVLLSGIGRQEVGCQSQSFEDAAAFEDAVRKGPQAKECMCPLEIKENKTRFSPRASRKERGLVDTLILAQ